MAKHQMTIDINAPVETVFTHLDDAEFAKQWIGGLDSMEVLTEGGNRVGAKTKHIYIENGRTIEMLEETLVYEPDKKVKIYGKTDGFELTVQYELEAIATGTRLHYEAETNMTSFMMKLMSVIINHSSNNKTHEDLNRLKSLIEN